MKAIGVICGGFSSEFSISVKSARNIATNLPAEYESYLIFLRKEGWTIEVNGNELPFDQTNFSFQHGNGSKMIDIAIVYIHGDPGENGKVQAYLEMIGVPYVNSGPLASQLSFDKWFCNQFLARFEIPVAKSFYLSKAIDTINVDRLLADLGLPVFVKPCDSGSSFGISRVNRKDDLIPAINKAFEEGRTIVIESYLNGTEITCGVYRNCDGTQALPLTEIVSENEFFDFNAKYEGASQEITPARISNLATERTQELATQIYDLLQLRSIARIDFMLVDEVPYVIEVNTTPGFSNESIVPKMIATKGMTTKQLWVEILEAELD